jgi:hypothetical protein
VHQGLKPDGAMGRRAIFTCPRNWARRHPPA